MTAFIRQSSLSLLLLLCLLGHNSAFSHGEKADWIHVGGNVDFEGIPLCALVLINGQSQFSCDGNGRYDMEVPADQNGMITVQVFVDGFAPFSQIVTPDQAASYPVAMAKDQDSPTFDVSAVTEPSVTEGWLVVSGSIKTEGTPVCALVLANGQSMFSCEGSGQYSLDVPLDQDGNVTLMVFAAGFKPYKRVINSQNPPGPSAPTAEGLWVGQTNNNQAVTALVLSDGSYYTLYSAEGDPSIIAGVLIGNSSMTGPNFISSNAKDFNLEGAGILSATVSAVVATKQSFDATITYQNGFTSTLSARYDSDYEREPSLASITGTFFGAVAFSQGAESAEITFSQDGKFSGAGESGCSVTGFAEPRTDGNVFNISIDFGGYPCFFSNQRFTGIAYFDSYNQQLYVVAPNANRTDGMIFLGSK